jgi:SAM-dependent methyltransferase
VKRDTDNPTFSHSLDSLDSEAGRRFEREKFLPKIEALRRRFGARLPQIRLLDVGVGYGHFLRLLETEAGIVDLHGMDPFPKSIEIASTQTSARIAQGDITDAEWPFEPGSFDAITCFDVVEHLAEPVQFFRKARRYLGPGGVAVVSTPNRSLPYLMRRIPLIGIPDTNPTHVSVRPPSYWRSLAQSSGYDVLEEWRGEHLTHLRLLPKLLAGACGLLGIDHRRVPLVRAFEQSYCIVVAPSLRTGRGSGTEA